MMQLRTRLDEGSTPRNGGAVHCMCQALRRDHVES